jgi:hypothetical protein
MTGFAVQIQPVHSLDEIIETLVTELRRTPHTRAALRERMHFAFFAHRLAERQAQRKRRKNRGRGRPTRGKSRGRSSR